MDIPEELFSAARNLKVNKSWPSDSALTVSDFTPAVSRGCTTLGGSVLSADGEYRSLGPEARDGQ
jgi:hypothetical protein